MKKNIILFVLYALAWILSFLNLGIFSNVSWVVLKLFVPVIGIIILLINVVLLIMRRYQHVNIRITGIVLGFIYIFPILLTMNVIRIAYPANIESASSVISIDSPFEKETIVAWGGDKIEDNLSHAGWSSERWAYDLVMAPYDTGNVSLESYGIWNERVFSPVAGTVISAYDQEIDIPPNQEEFESMEGNYVYIRIEETGTYLLLNHFKQDSIAVKAGDAVKTGDFIGHVGNSGTTSEPHLHIHHQRENPLEIIHPIIATGLPLYFKDNQKDIMPVRGEILNKDL